MKELIVSTKEQGRVQVLNDVLTGTLKISEGAMLLGVSERHAWCGADGDRREVVAAVAHGNRRRPPAHTLSEVLV